MNDETLVRRGAHIESLVGRLCTYAAADDLLPSERADLLMAADNIESLDRAQAWAYEEVIPRLEAEVERLRAALEACEHQTHSLRTWGGTSWNYHPPQAKRIAEIARGALLPNEPLQATPRSGVRPGSDG